jgi:hypothetical protein
VIPRGHVHRLVPVSVYDRPDRSTVIQSRCQAVMPTGAAPDLVCSLEEERVFHGQTPLSIRYRFGGQWFAAIDLLRLLPISVQECPECHGEPTLLPCTRCSAVGLVENDGSQLRLPDLKVT